MGHVERAQTDCSLAATGARHARRRLSRPVERPLIGTFGSHALCPFTQVPENLKSRLLLAGPTPCVRHFTGDVSWMEISSRYSRAMSERPMLQCIWVSQPARLKSIVAKIGSASRRERVCQYVYISEVAIALKKKKE